LAIAIEANGGFEFNLEDEELNPLKGKLLIPLDLQLMITAQDVLQEQGPLSMEERCADVNWRFKIDISLRTLKLVYTAQKVKVKKVMLKAPVTPLHLMDKRRAEMRELKYNLEYLDEKKIKIYYMDEASFTAKDYGKYAWSNQRKNVQIDFQRSPKAVSVSAIVDETGLVKFQMRIGAMKKEDHWRLLRTFRSDLGH
jgi:hypothetical protein